MKRLLFFFALIIVSLLAVSQQDQQRELPLTEEAESLFTQAIVLSDFASQNCENVSANTPLIQTAILAIKDGHYQLEAYNVALIPNHALLHKYYVRTFEPPALIEFQVLSKDGLCDQFSFNLIVEASEE
tara:strand:- start:2267 stop:2653 length:387 start_codon:yes stop_codon:yes gene_type:complete